jgi:nicotinamide riboside kinase
MRYVVSPLFSCSSFLSVGGVAPCSIVTNLTLYVINYINMAYFDGSAGALVFHGAITGGNSSGKSSIIKVLRNDALTQECGLEEPFGVSLVEVQTRSFNPDDDGICLLPVLTVSEASRHIATQRGNPSILTDAYSTGVQRQIDFAAAGYPQVGESKLSGVFGRLRENADTLGRIASMGFILSDRGPIDGIVYADELLPDQDHDVFNGYPLRANMLFAAATTLDVVFVTDIHEVGFENDGARINPEDGQQRMRIHNQLASLYGQVSANPPVSLEGTIEQRRDRVLATVQGFALMDFVALNPMSILLQQ